MGLGGFGGGGGAVAGAGGGGGGGAASSIASNALFFKPSGTDKGPVVFDDFNDLYNQLETLRASANGSGRYEIIFDAGGPFGFLTVPLKTGGGAYDMSHVIWSPNHSGFSIVNVTDGVTCTGLRQFGNGNGIIFVVGQSLTTPVVADLVNNDNLLFFGANVEVVASGSPFFDGSTITSGQTIIFTFSQNSTIGNGPSGGRPVIHLSNSGSKILADIELGGPNRNSISGVAGSILRVSSSSGASQFGPQPNFLGTFDVDIAKIAPSRDVKPFLSSTALTAALSPLPATDGDYYYDVSGGAIVEDLPEVFDDVWLRMGHRITLFETSGTAGLTVIPFTGDKIEGVVDKVVTVPPGGSVTLACNGWDGWFIDKMHPSLAPDDGALTTATPDTLTAHRFGKYDSTAGNLVANIPAAADVKKGDKVGAFNQAGANSVTVTRSGGDTIDGAAADTVLAAGEKVILISDGVSDWTSQ